MCGLNPGHSAVDERRDKAGEDRSEPYKSFFSDKSVNDYPIRNTMVKWFELWGYKLESSPTTAGAFERSIIQTNWLQHESNNMHDQDIQKACIDNADSFIETCSELKPKMIFFLSKEILHAFSSNELSSRIEGIFGKKLNDPKCETKDITHNGKPHNKFKFFFQSYEKLEIVSIPHPTGTRSLADDYIASFKPEMESKIANWWHSHQKLLASK